MLQAKCSAIDRPTIESPRESHCVITVEMGEHIMLHILTLASEGWTVQMAPNPKYGRINGINDRQRTSSKILRAARLNKNHPPRIPQHKLHMLDCENDNALPVLFLRR